MSECLFSSRLALWREGLPFNKISTRNAWYLTWFSSACKVHSLIRSLYFSGDIWEVCVYTTAYVIACVGSCRVWLLIPASPFWFHRWSCVLLGDFQLVGCMGRTRVSCTLSYWGSDRWKLIFFHHGTCLRELMSFYYNFLACYSPKGWWSQRKQVYAEQYERESWEQKTLLL